jgi:hypothetical protein
MATDTWEGFKREFAAEADALGIKVSPYYVPGKAVPPNTQQARFCWREVGDTVRQVIEQGGQEAMRNVLDRLFADASSAKRQRIRNLVDFWASGAVRSRREVKLAWARYVDEHGLDKQSAEASTLYGLGMAFIRD